MQCPACGFENLPGLGSCARCASRLDLADVDVRPYRASDRGARWRRVRASLGKERRLSRWLSDAWGRLRDWSTLEIPRSAGGPPLSQRATWVLASIVPGLGHMLSGRRARGWWLLGVYLVALVCSLLFLSSLWSIYTVVLLSVHCFAVTDCLFYQAGYVRRATAMLAGLLVFGILMYGPYSGAIWVLEGFGRLQQIETETRWAALGPGDVVLMAGRWSAPHRYVPGDVVGYRISGHGAAHGHEGWYIRAGVLIDRILAGPGDHVVVKKGQLMVNGRPPTQEREMLVGTALPETLDLVVPQRCYFIYPTLANVADLNNQGPEIRMSVAIVGESAILGRLRMIVNPISRVRRF